MPEKWRLRRLYSWKGMYMACISPPGPADIDLLAYLDGEPDDPVAAHLAQCPHCRERAQGLARMQGYLTARLYRFDCPPMAELGEYHFGLLSSDQAAAVASHLAFCPHCAAEIAQLEGYLADLAPDLEPELGLLEKAPGRIRVLVARALKGGTGLDVLLQPAPALAGLRGDEGDSLIYEADEFQVVIEIHRDPDRPEGRTILGLVVGLDDPHQLEVHLWHADQRVASVTVEELGNFAIPGVSPGSYELILGGPEVEIHIQDLEVGTS
jgi:hypothetical protein